MKPVCLVGTMIAAVLFSGAAYAVYQQATATRVVYRAGQCGGMTQPITVADDAPVASPRPEPKQTPREREAADKLQRERIRLEIETNIVRLTRCVGRAAGCVANDFPRMLLGLTRSEVEALLGPPQYQLHLAGNQLYYWTVPLRTNRTVAPTRVQLIFGDCYYREKNSHKKAVCEATLH